MKNALLLLLLLIASGCAVFSQSSVQSENRNGQMTMIEALQDLCQLMSQEGLTATGLANHIGSIVQAGGGNVPTVVQPDDSAFQEARIMVKKNSNEPADVSLLLSDANALTLAELRDAFGDYTRMPRMRPGQPYKVMFRDDIPDEPFTCAIIASIKTGQEVAESSTVAALNLRRDIRLGD